MKKEGEVHCGEKEETIMQKHTKRADNFSCTKDNCRRTC